MRSKIAAKSYYKTQNANSMLRKEEITEDNPNETPVGEEGRKGIITQTRDEKDWWRK